MSSNYMKLCLSILEEHYGPIVRTVVEPLIKSGPLPISRLVSSSGIPISTVKESIQVLVQHNLVTVTRKGGSRDVLLSLDSKSIMLILRYPKFSSLIQKRYGEEAEVVFSNIIQTGRIQMTKLFYSLGSFQQYQNPKTDEKHLYETLSDYYKIVKDLAKENILIQAIVEDGDADLESSSKPQGSRVPYILTPLTQKVKGDEITDLNVKLICGQVISQKTKINELTEPSNQPYWKINFDKLDNEMKEELMFNAMTKRTRDVGAGLVFRAILQEGLVRNPYSATTSAVNIPEIKNALNKMENGQQALKHFDGYLDRMTKDVHQFVIKTSDLHAGLYVANVKSAFTELTWTTVEALIEAKHGTCATRIFRLVKLLKYAEQDHLLEKCMLSSKVGSSILYRLVQDHFINVKEIRKSYAATAAVNKVAYVFYIDFVKILLTLRELMYTTILNVRQRLNFEKLTYTRFLLKEKRVERILYYMTRSNCTEDQLDEVRETITVPERAILNKVHSNCDKLTSSIFSSDQTIFIIDTYFRYSKEK